eukprot:s7743_g1.t1
MLRLRSSQFESCPKTHRSTGCLIEKTPRACVTLKGIEAVASGETLKYHGIPYLPGIGRFEKKLELSLGLIAVVPPEVGTGLGIAQFLMGFMTTQTFVLLHGLFYAVSV